MSKKKIDWFKVFDKSVELLAKDNTLTQVQLAEKCGIAYKAYKNKIKIKELQAKMLEYKSLQEESKQEIFKQKARESAEKQYLSIGKIENIIDKDIYLKAKSGEQLDYKTAMQMKIEILKEKGELLPVQPELDELRDLIMQILDK